jgi:hypothetical protein
MQELTGIIVTVVVIHLAVLVALVLVITTILKGQSRRAVARIHAVEAEVRQKEEAIRREIEEHEVDFERRKAEAEESLLRQKDLSEKEMGKLREKMISEAKMEGSRILDQARRAEDQMRLQLAQETEEKALGYGGQIFSMVFSTRMTEALNRLFVDELLDAFEEIDADSITVDAKVAEITVSQPLQPEQRERLKRMLSEKFHADVEVRETVNRELLAGMLLKLGSLDIDGSLLNRYREAAEEVKRTSRM